MSHTIQTHNGRRTLRIGFTVAEASQMSVPECLEYLRANDPDGCYWPDDPNVPNVCEGLEWTLLDARLQVLVELQDYDRPDAVEWHETERVDALRAQLQTR